jgi:hypothetical protein
MSILHLTVERQRLGLSKAALARAADRHLNRRDIFRQNRAAALAEWCELMA